MLCRLLIRQTESGFVKCFIKENGVKLWMN